MGTFTTTSIDRNHGVRLDRNDVSTVETRTSFLLARLCIYLSRAGESVALAIAAMRWQWSPMPVPKPVVPNRDRLPGTKQQAMQRLQALQRMA